LAGRAIGFSVLLTWVPLLLLSALDGTAMGPGVGIAFLGDFLPYGRYLLVVPLLIVAEGVVGRKLGLALAELGRSWILAREAVSTLGEVSDRAVALWRGPYVMAALLVAVYGVTLATVWTGNPAPGEHWERVGTGEHARLGLAGLWHLLVSVPLLRFLTYRWLWRVILWTWVLWRVSRLPVRISLLHPDGAGGLGFLGSAQSGFAVLVLAFSTQLASTIANSIHYAGAELASYRSHAVLFVLIAVAFVYAPLLLFLGKLARAKREREAPLSGWASRAERVVADAVEEEDISRLLNGPEVSCVADFGVLMERARRMRLVPVSNRDMVAVVGAALLPGLPLLFVAMPAGDVLQRILDVLM
jgi:hypothetical protein